MKNAFFFIVVLLILVLSALQSCSNDIPKRSSYAIGIIMRNQHNSYYLDLDNEDKILFSDSVLINQAKLETGDRIIASYYILDQKADGYSRVVQLFDLYKILIKPIIQLTPEIKDSIGNDQIIINNLWICKDLLNIEFKADTGTGKHMVNLVSTENTEGFKTDYASMEFRYNSKRETKGVSEHLCCKVVSFKLGEYAPSVSQLKGLRIKANTIDEGEKIYTIEYGEKNSTPSIKISNLNRADSNPQLK